MFVYLIVAAIIISDVHDLSPFSGLWYEWH